MSKAIIISGCVVVMVLLLLTVRISYTARLIALDHPFGTVYICWWPCHKLPHPHFIWERSWEGEP